MKKVFVLSLFATTALMVCACGEYTQNVGCDAGEVKCSSEEKDGEKVEICYTCDESGKIWKKEICAFGIQIDPDDKETYVGCNPNPTTCKYRIQDGKCLCNDVCNTNFELIDDVSDIYEDSVHKKCSLDGTCICPQKCIYGCNPDGSCINYECADNIRNSNTGKCECDEENCEYGCKADGTCNEIQCIRNDIKHKSDGTCECSEDCSNGCNDNGSCICSSECVYGCDIDGSCIKYKCAENVQNSNTGECECKVEDCKYGCNADGSCNKIQCINGVINKLDGSCECNEKCPNGCNDNGSCICDNDKDNNSDKNNCMFGCYTDGTCYKLACVGNMANKDDGSCNCLSSCQDNCNPDGSCFYHCKEDKDCYGYTEGGNIFCDSSIGYRCSVKCNKDSDCMEGFICRSKGDGRCANEYFTTVWSQKLRENLYNGLEMMIHFKKNTSKSPRESTEYKQECFVDICWDWDENADHCDSTLDTYDLCDANTTNPIKYEYPAQDPNPKSSLIIKIRGNLNGYHIPDSDDVYFIDKVYAPHLIEVRSFGQVGLSRKAFKDCYNLKRVSSVDIPDASKLTSMESTFEYCCSFNSSLARWDVSNVENMNRTFAMQTKYQKINDKDDYKTCNNTLSNLGLNHWNVSHVKSMYELFRYSSFNQPLNEWDVSRVTSMYGMFADTPFDQPLKDWNTASVTSMAYMFLSNQSFDQDISEWNVSNVTTMIAMFSGAVKFNRYLGNWKPEKIKNAVSMFVKSGVAIDESNVCAIYNFFESHVGQLNDYNNPDLYKCGGDGKQQCIFDSLLQYLGVDKSVSCERD